MCVEKVEQGTQDTALWGSYVQGDEVGGELSHFHNITHELLLILVNTSSFLFLTSFSCLF